MSTRLRAITLTAALLALTVPASSSLAGHSTPTQKVRYDGLSSTGARFLNYDGSRNLDPHQRDWPITLVFYGNASISKAYNLTGYGGGGSEESEAYKLTSTAHGHFHTEGGKKSGCSNARDTHLRAYAIGHDQRLYDPKMGYIVVGSTHYDHGECASGSLWFGDSEQASFQIVTIARNKGYAVHRDAFQTHNYERHHTTRRDPHHIWENDSRASGIKIP
ncbi:MAG: hypothetical protein QOJ29_354 [Thermoleophilaceae bacterium]|nr:hypothetical protein [Thermoleophilaceae bacterium]